MLSSPVGWNSNNANFGIWWRGKFFTKRNSGHWRRLFEADAKDYFKPSWVAYSLHVAMWEHTHGVRMPKGYVVHHINHDEGDNSPCNLVCMKAEIHNKYHGWITRMKNCAKKKQRCFTFCANENPFPRVPYKNVFGFFII